MWTPPNDQQECFGFCVACTGPDGPYDKTCWPFGKDNLVPHSFGHFPFFIANNLVVDGRCLNVRMTHPFLGQGHRDIAERTMNCKGMTQTFGRGMKANNSGLLHDSGYFAPCGCARHGPNYFVRLCHSQRVKLFCKLWRQGYLSHMMLVSFLKTANGNDCLCRLNV